ncbi:MAG: hypothetical protein LIO42_03915 [Oscillospiraceae bacterium]|nr:hypothetical protein [Oscillospiraceae bacterium]
MKQGRRRPGGGLGLRHMALFGLLGGLTFGLKLALAPVPNVEPVSLLVMLFAAVFGLLCAPVCLLSGGPALALSWWLAGLPYDVIHGGSNFILAIGLFCPLRRLLEGLYRRAD